MAQLISILDYTEPQEKGHKTTSSLSSCSWGFLHLLLKTQLEMDHKIIRSVSWNQLSLVSGPSPTGGECLQLTSKQNCLKLNFFCSRWTGKYANSSMWSYLNLQKPVKEHILVSILLLPSKTIFLSISSNILSCTCHVQCHKHPVPFTPAKRQDHLLPNGISQYSSENNVKVRKASFSSLSLLWPPPLPLLEIFTYRTDHMKSLTWGQLPTGLATPSSKSLWLQTECVILHGGHLIWTILIL